MSSTGAGAADTKVAEEHAQSSEIGKDLTRSDTAKSSAEKRSSAEEGKSQASKENTKIEETSGGKANSSSPAPKKANAPWGVVEQKPMKALSADWPTLEDVASRKARSPPAKRASQKTETDATAAAAPAEATNASADAATVDDASETLKEKSSKKPSKKGSKKNRFVPFPAQFQVVSAKEGPRDNRRRGPARNAGRGVRPRTSGGRGTSAMAPSKTRYAPKSRSGPTGAVPPAAPFASDSAPYSMGRGRSRGRGRGSRGRGRARGGRGRSRGPLVYTAPYGAGEPAPLMMASASSFTPSYAPFTPVQPLFTPDLRLPAIQQVEYYFSVDNLCKDMFLRTKMDAEGFVSLSTIASFPRVKRLIANIDHLAEALATSEVIELKDGKLRKREGWEAWVLPAPAKADE